MNPESAMAPLVENPKKEMQNGMTIPPPPIPPTVEMDIMIIRRKSPMNSLPRIGKTSL